MTELLAGINKLVVPDSESLIVGGRASEELIVFLNMIAAGFNQIRALDVPEVDDITPQQLADDFGIIRIQESSTTSTTATSTTTAIPRDNTKPQITEGVEYQSLSFTPKRTDSKIMIEWLGTAVSSSTIGAIAIFKNGAADAIATISVAATENQYMRVILDSWGTSAQTISVRFGPGIGGTMYMGSGSTGAVYDNTHFQTLTITEYKATPFA